MADSLVDLGKKVRKQQKEVAKLQQQIDKLKQGLPNEKIQKQIEKLQKESQIIQDKRSLLEKTLNEKFEKIQKQISVLSGELPTLLQQGIKPSKETQKKQKELDALNKEMSAYEKYKAKKSAKDTGKLEKAKQEAEKEVDRVAKEKEKQEKEAAAKAEKVAEKEIEKQQKQAQKEQDVYLKQKEFVLKTIDQILSDPKPFQDILSPIASAKDGNLSFSAKFKAATSAIQLVASHAGNLAHLVKSKTFYAEEIDKLSKVLNGEMDYDPKNPPFFLKLLQDPELLIFLRSKGSSDLNKLIGLITPLITPILLQQLGNVEAIEKELHKKAKELEALPEKEKRLQELIELESRISKPAQKEEIEKLQKEVSALQSLLARYKTAKMLKSLEKEGIGAAYINEHILPILTEGLGEILSSPKELVTIAQLLVDRSLATDPAAKDAILAEILAKIDVAKLLQNKKLAEFLTTKNDDLVKIISTVIASNDNIKQTLAQYKITDQLVADLVPVFTKLAGSISKNADKTSRIYKALTDTILYDVTTKLKKAKILEEFSEILSKDSSHVNELIAAILPVLLEKETLEVILKDLPYFLEKNKSQLAPLLAGSIPVLLNYLETTNKDIVVGSKLDHDKLMKMLVLPVEKILKDLDPKFYQQVAPVAISLVANVLKATSVEDIQEFAKNIQILNTPDPSINPDLSIQERQQKKQEKDDALDKLIQQSLKILRSKEVIPVLRTALPLMLLDQNIVHGINKIVKNLIADNPAMQERLKQFGISSELIDSTIVLVTKTTATAFNNSPELLQAADDFYEYQKLGKRLLSMPPLSQIERELITTQQQKLLGNVLVSAEGILGGMSSAIDDISSYLRDNKKNIEQIADKALAQPQFQEVLESVGVSHALVREIAANGVDFIASALPLFTKLAQESLKDKEGMIQLMNQFQAAVNAPEAERGKLTMKLVDEIFAFKDRNPEVNRILQEDLPKLLVDNSEGLGKIVDKFLTDSPTGRNINIKGKDIIAVASKNLPQLIEISVLNKNGNYAKLIPKLFKLVTSDKEVLNLVMKAANDWLHYKVQKALTPNIIRKKSADQIGEVLENIGKTADKNNADLGELIGLEAEKHSDKTARYSLRNRDFSGLDLSKQSLNFERRTVEGFNFAGAKLGTISFAGSTIKDCSFKNVKFQKHVSFEGATIDAKSLKTLRTAVAKYNKKHPNKPITLEGIKIIKGKGIFNKSILAEIEVIKRKISGQRPSSTKSKATSQKSQSVLKR